MRIAYRAIDLTAGEHDGTAASATGARIVASTTGRGHWTSPEIRPGFAFGELVATWHARTPGDSWVEVAARVAAAGGWSGWLRLARWADHDTAVRPSSVPGEADEAASVAVDTLRAAGDATAWQLRIGLVRPAGGESPVLSYAGAMVSERPAGGPPSDRGVRPERSGAGTSLRGVDLALNVPALSQRVHAGHYPQWGGGGDAWCSPTCTAMVLGFWGTGPDRTALSWVDPSYPDPAVYDAVRHTYDHAYGGAGNWSFNAAYAARFGLCAFVTRLRGLAEAEAFIAAGIPLIASLRVDPDRLAGADYDSDGHLMVLVGFTAGGDVIVNDPAARRPSTVRRSYRRSEFEAAWRGGSGGVVYVMHPESVALPPRPPEPNW